jgi:hypothetical protein
MEQFDDEDGSLADMFSEESKFGRVKIKSNLLRYCCDAGQVEYTEVRQLATEIWRMLPDEED